MTKDGIAAIVSKVVAPMGAAFVWSSVCESFVAIKLQLPANATAAQFDAASLAARAAVEKLAKDEGLPLLSFVVEFVNEGGTIVATRKFGSSGGATGATSSPTSTPASTSAPAAATQAPRGHEPIPGLAPSNRAAPGPSGPAGLPGIKHVIAVGAGKGGVGKSTVSLNLAVGLARRGHAVGLLDGDIYGPSMPTMLDLESHEAMTMRGMLQPFYVHGIKCMTIGKLVPSDKPLIWRGPMAHGAFKQLTEQTEWGELDYLIIDLPPGTGDVSLTMAQTMRLSGAVVVCTPQKVAQDDAVRAARMFQQLQIDVLGVVENMSYFVGDDGKVYDLFGRGGAEVMAQRLNLSFLGSIPITMSLRVNSDKGDPTSNFTGTDTAGKALREKLDALVTNVENQVALAEMRRGSTRPVLTIS
jgi:ATP-binding protein involved in chromosome partitioning